MGSVTTSSRPGLRQAWTRTWDRLLNSYHAGAHQLSHATGADRYPAQFRAARTWADAQAIEAPRILSYGCSSGEECLSLLGYFPAAKIVGADVSERILARARRTCAGQPRIELLGTDRIRAEAPYDLVFAMSVLCRHKETRRREDCSRVYPFQRFEAAVRELADVLAPGGLLVLYNANFRFSETAVFADFDPVEVPGISESGFVAKFDRHNRRLADPRDPHCLFRKRPR